MQKPQRNNSLDILKGFAIVAVVLGHVLLGIQESPSIQNAAWVSNILRWIYSFHMSLFFFVAGMLAHNAPFKKILQDKTKRLVLPYFSVGILFWGIHLGTNTFTNYQTSLDQIWHLFYLPYGHLWYLFSLFFIFLLAQPTNKYIQAPALRMALMLALELSSYWINTPYFTLTNILFFMAYFEYGFSFRNNKRPKLLSYLALGLFVFVSMSVITYEFTGLLQHIFKLAAGFVAIESLSWISQKLAQNNSGKIWEWLGYYSYDIYLLHILFTAGTRIFLTQLHFTDPMGHIILGSVFGILGSYLIFRLIIRPVPVLRRLCLGYDFKK